MSERAAEPVEDLFPNLGSQPVDEPDEEPEEDDRPEEPEEEPGESDEPDEPDDDDDDEEPEEYEVIVDGEPTKVGLQEALDGYIRQETFHRRMNRVADSQRAVQERFGEIEQSRARYLERIDTAEKLIDTILPEEPNWDSLYEQDATQARQIEKNFRNMVATKSALAEERRKVAVEHAVETERHAAAYAVQELPKFERIAGWKSGEDRKRDLDAMRDTATKAGFSAEELGQVLDSRMLNLLLKASKYDRAQAGKTPTRVSGQSRAQRVARNGAVGNKATPKRAATAAKRLSRTGSIEDASAVFKEML